MREGKLRDEVERAAQAEAVLNNPVLADAFVQLEKQFMDAWRQSSVGDTENRERIYHLCAALEAVKGHLTTVVENGKIAQANLDKL